MDLQAVNSIYHSSVETKQVNGFQETNSINPRTIQKYMAKKHNNRIILIILEGKHSMNTVTAIRLLEVPIYAIVFINLQEN
jgi:cephalosporin hydroxylase